MNIIEIQDDLLHRMTLVEGDLVILRNVINSLETTVNNLSRRVYSLEQKPSIVEEDKVEDRLPDLETE